MDGANAGIILCLFVLVVVGFTGLYYSGQSVADSHVYLPINNSSHHDAGESIIYFTVSDSITGKPVPGMWIECNPLTGANSGNTYVWSTNKTGVAMAYSGQGPVAYRVAHGSQDYRMLPGSVDVVPGVQYVDVKLLPIGGNI